MVKILVALSILNSSGASPGATEKVAALLVAALVRALSMGSLLWHYRRSLRLLAVAEQEIGDSAGTPLEIVFQEQSYSSFHSRLSLAWDHFHGDIANPCGIIADFCGVIADFCGVIADYCLRDLNKHRKTLFNLVKHHETLLKLSEAS